MEKHEVTDMIETVDKLEELKNNWMDNEKVDNSTSIVLEQESEILEIFRIVNELSLNSSSERESIGDFDGVTHMC